MTKYSPEYFIAKFEAIPDEKWTTGQFDNGRGQHCALGHCGERMYDVSPDEAAALRDVFNGSSLGFGVMATNDFKYELGDHPKERVVNALTLIASGALKDV